MGEQKFEKWLAQKIVNGDAFVTAKDALDSLEAERRFAQTHNQSFDDSRWTPIEKSLRRYPEGWTIAKIAEVEDRQRRPSDDSRNMRS